MATCSCGLFGMDEGGWWIQRSHPRSLDDPSNATVAVRDGYCIACGDRLICGGGVESRADMERDAKRMRILDADGPLLDGNGSDGYYTSYGSVRKLSEVADMLLVEKGDNDGN